MMLHSMSWYVTYYSSQMAISYSASFWGPFELIFSEFSYCLITFSAMFCSSVYNIMYIYSSPIGHAFISPWLE